MTSDDSRDETVCPCCGWVACEGEVFDGADLLCGCAGQVSVDAESAYVVIDDEEPCPPNAKCQIRKE